MRKLPKSRAFTLVELLTVIAIVGVLVAILIPVVANMKRQAGLSTCTSNLRQLYNGTMLYTQENNGRFMPAQYTNNNGDKLLWPYLLLTYMNYPNQDEFKEKFSCPEYLGNQNGTFWMLGYAVNEVPAYLGDSAPGTNKQKNGILNRTEESGFQGYMLVNITELSGRLMFADGTDWHVNHQGGLGFMEYGRHQEGKTNAVFFDGRVESLTQEKAELAVTDPRLYNQGQSSSS